MKPPRSENARDGKKHKPAPENVASERPQQIESGNSLETSLHAVAAPSSHWSDENLLESARTHWQLGDWESLSQMDNHALETHAERAKLALLVACAYQQMNDHDNARLLLHLSKAWGCNRKLIARLLVAGVHNTLGRAAALAREEQRALTHFRQAVDGAKGDAQLACHARSVREVTKLGLLPQAAAMVDQKLKALNSLLFNSDPRIKVLQTELDLLHHELSLAQQRKQLAPRAEAGDVAHTEDKNTSHLRSSLRERSVSQLGQDLWVLETLNYKHGGYFVEFGATDGVLLSNTWLLEAEFAWNGMCIEPNPKLFAQLQRNRQCMCLSDCIGSEDGKEMEFILADAYGSLADYATSDKHTDKRAAYRESGSTMKVRTKTLNTVLEQHRAPRDIDYMSIDTEGSELDILRSFDFAKWNVKLLTVEHNYREPHREDIRRLMGSHGYKVREANFDDWFWRDDLLD